METCVVRVRVRVSCTVAEIEFSRLIRYLECENVACPVQSSFAIIVATLTNDRVLENFSVSSLLLTLSRLNLIELIFIYSIMLISLGKVRDARRDQNILHI